MSLLSLETFISKRTKPKKNKYILQGSSIRERRHTSPSYKRQLGA